MSLLLCIWNWKADEKQKRSELKRYFVNTWETYESLFSLINDDAAYYLRPEPLRHPLVFYYGSALWHNVMVFR